MGAGLVAQAEHWRWSGLWARMQGEDAVKAILAPWPVERPVDWTDRVNPPLSAKEWRVRVSIERGRPFGEDEWVKRTASELRLEHTIRPEGRPPKPVSSGLRNCRKLLRHKSNRKIIKSQYREMKNLYTLYYLHRLNTVVNLGMLGKISSYPTYPIAVILKMAMHLGACPSI